MSIVVRTGAVLAAAALLQLPLAGPAGAAPSATQRADVAPPAVRHWEAQVVRDRLKLLPSKAEIITTVVDRSAVKSVKARFVRGATVYGGEAVNTHGNSWRATFEMPAADTTGLYEVWVEAQDAPGNAASTRVGTLLFP